MGVESKRVEKVKRKKKKNQRVARLMQGINRQVGKKGEAYA
jgi:hypothetical protein